MLNVFHVYVVVDDPVVCKSLQRLLEMGNFRWTAIFENQDGKWMTVHEHVSAPLQ